MSSIERTRSPQNIQSINGLNSTSRHIWEQIFDLRRIAWNIRGVYLNIPHDIREVEIPETVTVEPLGQPPPPKSTPIPESGRETLEPVEATCTSFTRAVTPIEPEVWDSIEERLDVLRLVCVGVDGAMREDYQSTFDTDSLVELFDGFEVESAH